MSSSGDLDFKVIINQTLFKKTKITTSDYREIEDWDDDAGKVLIIDTENIDWENLYKDQHYTPEQLISECKCLAKELYDIYKDQANTPQNRKELAKLSRIMEECQGWTEEDLSVYKQ